MLDWSNPPFAKWFVGGKLNVAYNCVDRHVEAGHGDQVAYYWEGEPADDTRTITYAELKDEVCKAANALLELGVPGRRPGRDLHADDPRDGRSRCWPAPASAPSTWSCSAASPPTPWPAGSTTPAPSWSSPPTAATAAAPQRAQAGRGRRGRPQPRRPQRARGQAHRSRTSSGPRAATSGGTTSSSGSPTEHEPRVLRRRAPALHHVHVRDDGEAEGHPAHHAAAT